MAYCDTFTSNLECVIEYNNLITYKAVVLGILFFYSCYVIYMNRDGWGDSNDLFNFFKVLLQRSTAYLFLILSPLISMLFRPTIDFELFMYMVVSFYLIVIFVVVGMSLLFFREKLKSLYNYENKMKIKEKIKFRKGEIYNG